MDDSTNAGTTARTFKQKLASEKQRLEELLERTGNHLYRRQEPYSADFSEQVVDVENNQVIEALDQEGAAELILTRQALKRIEEGTYGICAAYGEEINIARLEVIPQSIGSSYRGARCPSCITVQNGAQLIHANLTLRSIAYHGQIAID